VLAGIFRDEEPFAGLAGMALQFGEGGRDAGAMRALVPRVAVRPLRHPGGRGPALRRAY